MKFLSTGKKLKLCLTLFLLSLASTAHADAGTPLMWTTFLHLSIGNAIIGIAEGLLIIYLFRLRRRFAIPIMIVANYLSMIAGMVLIPFLYGFVKPGDDAVHLAQMTGTLWKMGLLTFVLTLFVEWPFCLCLFAREKGNFRKSILADLAAQTASYAILIPIYLYSSLGLDMVREVQIDQTIVAFMATQGTVYFISLDDMTLRSVALSGVGEKKVMDLPRKDKDGKELDWGYHRRRLTFYPSAKQNAWDLWIKDDSPDHNFGKPSEHPNSNDIPLIKDLAGRAATPKETTSFARYAPADLRGDQASENHILVDTYGPMSCITGLGREMSFFVETPFMRWDGGSPTLLPGSKIVLEFDGQILLYDLQTKKIGLIANGRQPVVILHDDAGKP